jgi:hypothetical protein
LAARDEPYGLVSRAALHVMFVTEWSAPTG